MKHALVFDGDRGGRDTFSSVPGRREDDDVLIDGDDIQIGNGRRILLGGIGSDRLVGDTAGDMPVPVATDFDAYDQAICNLFQDWPR